MSGGRRVLILGGTGFIGRNLVRYLVESHLASFIRVADKTRPEMAWLSSADADLFKQPPVEYLMSNLVNPQSVQKTFTLDSGQFDVVVNLAAVGPYGQDAEFYEAKLLHLARLCGAEAVKRRIPRWIEVSTAQVYKSKKSKPANEGTELKPWTSLAASKLSVEGALIKAGVPAVILRPAIVYGQGDITGLMPRLVCGYVYRKTGEEMKLLWSGDLPINTVHVRDVAKAIWFVTSHGSTGDVFNLADTNATDQAKISAIISRIFKIKTGFHGNMVSQFAKMNFKKVVEQANEEHMEPWGEITAAASISRTPLSPFLEPELLLKHALAVDGRRITQLGFAYEVPAPTDALLLESLQYWIGVGVLPPV
jgi:nucleoside-diphosphate-sugar epimerase